MKIKPSEQELLRLYRQLSQLDQQALLELARGWADLLKKSA